VTPALRHPALQPGWIDRPHQVLPLGDMPLESGETIEDAHLCYVTHGALNAARDNAILVLAAIGATHHRLDFLIGERRALDPSRFFVVCVDALGNGLSISPSNSRHQPGDRFPRFTIRDMVASQARLLGTLGIGQLAAVCGASMGGMQALQWAVSHPARVGKLVAMTPMARTSSWSRVITALSRQALADAATSPRGWTLWAGLMKILASRTPEAVARSFAAGGNVETFLQALGDDAVINGPDPLDWIYQTHAYDAHDVAATPGEGGTIEQALARAAMPALVMAPPLDLFNPADGARRIASLLPQGRFVEIPSIEGHQSASTADPADAAFLNRTIRAFLS
jgi:homoserine O-acetyltransferase